MMGVEVVGTGKNWLMRENSLKPHYDWKRLTPPPGGMHADKIDLKSYLYII